MTRSTRTTDTNPTGMSDSRRRSPRVDRAAFWLLAWIILAPSPSLAAQETPAAGHVTEVPVGWNPATARDRTGGVPNPVPSIRDADDAVPNFDDAAHPKLTRPGSTESLSPPQSLLPISPIDPSGMDRQSEKQSRYDEIRRRLRELSRRWQSPAGPPESASNERSSDDTPAADERPEGETASIRSRDDGQPSMLDTPAKTTNPVDSPESGAPLTGTESHADDADADAVSRLDQLTRANAADVISGPIDRVALADNLYALGEYTLALEMYTRVDQSAFPADQRVWVDYQTACCLRRLRRHSDARERYRRLAAQKDVPWLADISRWWLDRIDDRSAAAEQLQRIDQVLTLLKADNDDTPGN